MRNVKQNGRWLLPLILIAVLAVPASAALLPAANSLSNLAAPHFQTGELTWTQVQEQPRRPLVFGRFSHDQHRLRGRWA